MSKHTAANLFMVPPLQAGLYQQLLASVISFQELGNRLIRYAYQAKAFRRAAEVRQAAEILCNLPVKDFQVIGQYYLAWCERRTNPQASNIFEKIAENAPPYYRALAMHSLAALSAREQDYESELYWFAESLKVHPSPEAFIGLAVIKAKQGDHRHAVKDLEHILPFMKYAPPHIYFDYLNSLAVELAEAGRKYEARNVIKPVLESPLIIAYPEWRETAEDVKGPNRSFAVLNPTRRRRKGKLLSMPVIEHAEPIEEGWPAPVVNLETWKANMGKKKNGGDHEDLDSRQLLLKVMELSTAPGMTDGKLLQVIQYMYKLLIDVPKPDDDGDDNEPSA